MGASVTEIADLAVKLRLTYSKHIRWPTLAARAVEGKGIRNASDIKRLSKEVVSELGRRGVIVKRAKKSRQNLVSP